MPHTTAGRNSRGEIVLEKHVNSHVRELSCCQQHVYSLLLICGSRAICVNARVWFRKFDEMFHVLLILTICATVGGSLKAATEPTLRKTLDDLCARVATLSSRDHTALMFENLAKTQIALGLAVSKTQPRDALTYLTDAVYYATLANVSALHHDAETTRAELVSQNKHYFRTLAKRDGHKVGDVVFAFVKRRSGAKTAEPRRVHLLKISNGWCLIETFLCLLFHSSGSKQLIFFVCSILFFRVVVGGLAGRVYIQLQSGRRRKQSLPYTWLHPVQKFSMPIPRLTTRELLLDKQLLTGNYPFVITDAMVDWPALNKWRSLDYLDRIVPQEWVDFYPRNMFVTQQILVKTIWTVV